MCAFCTRKEFALTAWLFFQESKRPREKERATNTTCTRAPFSVSSDRRSPVLQYLPLQNTYIHTWDLPDEYSLNLISNVFRLSSGDRYTRLLFFFHFFQPDFSLGQNLSDIGDSSAPPLQSPKSLPTSEDEDGEMPKTYIGWSRQENLKPTKRPGFHPCNLGPICCHVSPPAE